MPRPSEASLPRQALHSELSLPGLVAQRSARSRCARFRPALPASPRIAREGYACVRRNSLGLALPAMPVACFAPPSSPCHKQQCLHCNAKTRLDQPCPVAPSIACRAMLRLALLVPARTCLALAGLALPAMFRHISRGSARTRCASSGYASPSLPCQALFCPVAPLRDVLRSIKPRLLRLARLCCAATGSARRSSLRPACYGCRRASASRALAALLPWAPGRGTRHGPLLSILAQLLERRSDSQHDNR